MTQRKKADYTNVTYTKESLERAWDNFLYKKEALNKLMENNWVPSLEHRVGAAFDFIGPVPNPAIESEVIICKAFFDLYLYHGDLNFSDSMQHKSEPFFELSTENLSKETLEMLSMPAIYDQFAMTIAPYDYGVFISFGVDPSESEEDIIKSYQDRGIPDDLQTVLLFAQLKKGANVIRFDRDAPFEPSLPVYGEECSPSIS